MIETAQRMPNGNVAHYKCLTFDTRTAVPKV